MWLKEVVSKLGDIVLAGEDLVIEWLKKLKSAKILIAMGILICCFVVVGYTLYIVVAYSDMVSKNQLVVVTVFSLTELLAGGVVGWLFKLRKDERSPVEEFLSSNEINGEENGEVGLLKEE